MNWYIGVLKRYAVFSGRARREEYWMFVLFNFIIALVLAFLEELAGIPGVLTLLYALAVIVPSIAVAVRRLHDTGRSGWWLFIGLVPVIGFGVLVIFFLIDDSQINANQYGDNPKASTA